MAHISGIFDITWCVTKIGCHKVFLFSCITGVGGSDPDFIGYNLVGYLYTLGSGKNEKKRRWISDHEADALRQILMFTMIDY